jgi:hypothetical protein
VVVYCRVQGSVKTAEDLAPVERVSNAAVTGGVKSPLNRHATPPDNLNCGRRHGVAVSGASEYVEQ